MDSFLITQCSISLVLINILQLRNYRFMGLVMAVEADKIATFRQELKSLINES